MKLSSAQMDDLLALVNLVSSYGYQDTRSQLIYQLDGALLLKVQASCEGKPFEWSVRADLEADIGSRLAHLRLAVESADPKRRAVEQTLRTAANWVKGGK